MAGSKKATEAKDSSVEKTSTKKAKKSASKAAPLETAGLTLSVEAVDAQQEKKTKKRRAKAEAAEAPAEEAVREKPQKARKAKSAKKAKAAERISSLEKKPLSGQMPAMARQATRNVAWVTGMRRRSPPMADISFECTAWMMKPAPRKSSALNMACVKRWNIEAM